MIENQGARQVLPRGTPQHVPQLNCTERVKPGLRQWHVCVGLSTGVPANQHEHLFEAELCAAGHSLRLAGRRCAWRLAGAVLPREEETGHFLDAEEKAGSIRREDSRQRGRAREHLRQARPCHLARDQPRPDISGALIYAVARGVPNLRDGAPLQARAARA